jgi:hypothetical protein
MAKKTYHEQYWGYIHSKFGNNDSSNEDSSDNGNGSDNNDVE